MITITKPMCKLSKVIHLLKIANELNILTDTMFDELMDKYEKNFLMFDFMFENIDTCILSKVSVQITADNFNLLLKIQNYAELLKSNVYMPYKNSEY